MTIVSKGKNNVNQFNNYTQNTTENKIDIHKNTTVNINNATVTINNLFDTTNTFLNAIVNIFNDIVSSLKEPIKDMNSIDLLNE